MDNSSLLLNRFYTISHLVPLGCSKFEEPEWKHQTSASSVPNLIHSDTGPARATCPLSGEAGRGPVMGSLCDQSDHTAGVIVRHPPSSDCAVVLRALVFLVFPVPGIAFCMQRPTGAGSGMLPCQKHHVGFSGPNMGNVNAVTGDRAYIRHTPKYTSQWSYMAWHDNGVRGRWHMAACVAH